MWGPKLKPQGPPLAGHPPPKTKKEHWTCVGDLQHERKKTEKSTTSRNGDVAEVEENVKELLSSRKIIYLCVSKCRIS